MTSFCPPSQSKEVHQMFEMYLLNSSLSGAEQSASFLKQYADQLRHKMTFTLFNSFLRNIEPESRLQSGGELEGRAQFSRLSSAHKCSP